jgi:hypothetical protein
MIVNSRPTPTLSEAVAVGRLCEHGLRFLFSATRRRVAASCCIRAMTAISG